MIPATLLNAVAQSSAQRLVNSFLEGLLVAALVWLVLRLVPRQNASTRFSLWMAALLSIAILPVAEALARVNRQVSESLTHVSVSLPASWGIALFTVWSLVVFFLLARVAFGIVQLIRLRASAAEVDPASLPEASRQTLMEFQQHRNVGLCVSERVSVPTAVGLFRPAVLLPTWALAELSPADLNSVLVHELAHLRRRDDWTNLFQNVVCALFFFHPAVWWIENRLSLEREMACDEHVLANAADAHAYAECLVSLAERGFLHRAMSLAQGAVHRVKECSARVAQILNGGSSRTARASRIAVIGGASGLLLLLGTFAQAPDLVAFGSPTHTNSVAATNTATLAQRSAPAASVIPAAWHPESQAVPLVTPAVYKARPVAFKRTRMQQNNNPARLTHTPAPQSTARDSNPMLYRTALTTSQANPAPEALVIVRQASFYPDGTAIWSVSVYRMAVHQPQPQAQNDISRKAI